jgi:putative polyhydroxyalkanoate system protein
VSDFTVSIPHNLSRDEARQRLQDGLARARREVGSMVTGLTERWDGDTLSFSVSAAGQTVSGQAFVEDHAIRVEATLPWMLAMLAGPLRRQIEHRGREALADKSNTSMPGSGRQT